MVFLKLKITFSIFKKYYFLFTRKTFRAFQSILTHGRKILLVIKREMMILLPYECQPCAVAWIVRATV